MEILGWVFLGILALIVLTAATMGLLSFPDAKRYLQIRRM